MGTRVWGGGTLILDPKRGGRGLMSNHKFPSKLKLTFQTSFTSRLTNLCDNFAVT